MTTRILRLTAAIITTILFVALGCRPANERKITQLPPQGANVPAPTPTDTKPKTDPTATPPTPSNNETKLVDCKPNGLGSDRVIYVGRSKKLNDKRLEHLIVLLVNNGQVEQRLIANSGQPNNQIFQTAAKSKSGSNEPAPEAIYKISPRVPGSPKDTAGEWFYPIDFVPKTKKHAMPRQDLGFHFDNDRAQSPGSRGCIAFTTLPDFSTFETWMAKGAVSKVVVDYGLKTVGDIQIPDSCLSAPDSNQ